MSTQEVAVMLAILGFFMGCAAVYGFVSGVIAQLSAQTRRAKRRAHISRFWASRIRWGLKAGRTPEWWPAYIFLTPTRRAFDRSFYRTPWRRGN